jgi:phospholipase C
MELDPIARLMKVQHIVVLMMENRSFDQMLGYLRRAGLEEVEGLTGGESNPDDQGNPVPVYEYGPDETVFHPPEDATGKILDPCHSQDCVMQQLEGPNQGFVKNFIATRSKPIGAQYHRLPMGYYGAQDLPVYDLLARGFCVCDHWHSSVPGDTWQNRLYAVAGKEAPNVIPPELKGVAREVGGLVDQLAKVPIYDAEAFTRQLTADRWRWYAHDPATLRAVDATYRNFNPIDQPYKENFAFFNRQTVSLLTRLLEGAFLSGDSFLDDAANGTLRPLSWIDPNFIDLKVLDPASNDDHPPSDIRAGQSLVLEIYEALRKSPVWNDTLLVIVYDEHGGFFDHVPPPAVPDDGSGHATLGVRIPALLVGPRVPQQVCKEQFDHTTLIKTILTRFAADPAAAIEKMGQRVGEAQHLGVALLEEPRAATPDPKLAREAINAWHVQAREERRATPEGPSKAEDGAGQQLYLRDFQEDFARFALHMRSAGLKAGEP